MNESMSESERKKKNSKGLFVICEGLYAIEKDLLLCIGGVLSSDNSQSEKSTRY